MNHIVLVYDSITNAVFEGQVAAPLVRRLHNEPLLHVHIISFEHTTVAKHYDALCSLHPRLHIKIYTKTRFFLGIISVWHAAYQLQKYVYHFKSYTLQARGPIAAVIGYQCITHACTLFILQARGLLAEEFLYSYQQKSHTIVTRWVYYIRYLQLVSFEKSVYQHVHNGTTPIILESVTQGLETYICTHFSCTIPSKIIASDDIPQSIDTQTKHRWRTEIRTRLHIPESYHVYVYNGSHKPWQCFKESVALFHQHFLEHKADFLLVITQDPLACQQDIESFAIPKNRYAIMTCNHAEVLPFLSAADKGILLRKSNLINWISRPTKALEYTAVRIPIIHNGTVEYLQSLSECIELSLP